MNKLLNLSQKLLLSMIPRQKSPLKGQMLSKPTVLETKKAHLMAKSPTMAQRRAKLLQKKSRATLFRKQNTPLEMTTQRL